MRRDAKTINFGITYGMGVYGLAESAGIPRQKAKEFIENYFKIYSNVRKFLDGQKEKARDLGYVETLFGRKRYLPDINSNVVMIKNAAERMAINHPIQGTAADIMKMAMIKVLNEIKERFKKYHANFSFNLRSLVDNERNYSQLMIKIDERPKSALNPDF